MSLRFGLRLKIVTIMVAVLVALASAAILMVNRQSQSAAEAEERVVARQELRRALQAFDFQFVQISAALAGWDLQDVVAEKLGEDGRGVVATEEHLRQSQLDWFALLDAEGHLPRLTELDGDHGELPLQAFASANPAAFRRLLAKVNEASARAGCGLLGLGQQLGLFCFRPLHTDERRDTLFDVALVGRHLTPGLMNQLSQQMGSSVALVDAPAKGSTALGAAVRAGLGEGVPRIALAATTMTVDFPLTDFAGVQAGALRLTLERTALLQFRESRAHTLNLLLLTIFAVGLVTITVVDRLVVRRVEALREDLSAIVASNTWDGRVRTEGTDEIDELSQFINNVIGVVREQIVQLRSLSHSDPLTSLPNRRHFTERYADAFKLHKRNHNALSLVLFDADCFKSYNDRYGHPNGDLALITIADCLQQAARRPGDLPVRLGGEEFALLLEDTNMEGALSRATSVLQAVVEAGIRHEGSTVAPVLTLSGGLAEMEAGDTPESLYRRADEALYQAKTGGRNRVVVAASRTPAG